MSNKKQKVLNRKKVRRRPANDAVAASATDQYVTIANDAGEVFRIELGSTLQYQAKRWSYSIARRSRWKNSLLQKMQADAKETLESLADKATLSKVLSNAKVVDIRVPFVTERRGWEARITPWEFLIGASAAALGNPHELTIVRSLVLDRESKAPADTPTLLYIQSAPGIVADFCDFSNELAMVKNTYNNAVISSFNPTIAELRILISEQSPDIIHIAGVDNHEFVSLAGAKQLPEAWAESDIRDGLILRSDDDENTLGLEMVRAEQLAEVLTCAATPPELVIVNVFNSASRMCALTVANGASCAIGYQDSIENALAEILLDEFYLNYYLSKDCFASFSTALAAARTTGEVDGTGVALYSDRVLISSHDAMLEGIRSSRAKASEALLSTGDGDPDYKLLRVDIQVRKELNYSMLHNDSGGLFERFVLSKKRSARLENREINNICIEANLHLGSDSHTYQSRFTLSNNIKHIDKEVKVPLTSSVMRTVSEALRTSISVKVSVGNEVVVHETFRVTLLPADEWKDSNADRVWLPSFVMPRDPAVATIIDRAQKYLATLADDMTLGFVGYQHESQQQDGDAQIVDLQVRAIWAAIINDFDIRYINPPPSYSTQGQRLRTPTQVIQGRRGTCIDLALLFCSCLEYIDVFPVIFLFDGHAFAGFWRSELQYSQFLVSQLENGGSEAESSVANPGQTGTPWVFSTGSHDEVMAQVDNRAICPLETVKLTSRGSFKHAVACADEDLQGYLEFNALLDISLARSEFITPLPIIE